MVVLSDPGKGCGGRARRVAAVLRGGRPVAEAHVDPERRQVAAAGTADADGPAQVPRRVGSEGARLGA